MILFLAPSPRKSYASVDDALMRYSEVESGTEGDFLTESGSVSGKSPCYNLWYQPTPMSSLGYRYGYTTASCCSQEGCLLTPLDYVR